MRIVQMQSRQARAPIELSESDSSGKTSEDDQQESESIAISRVVSEILGREPLDGNDESLFMNPADVPTASLGCADNPGRVVDKNKSPVGFQDKDKPETCRKRDKQRTERKDAIQVQIWHTKK